MMTQQRHCRPLRTLAPAIETNPVKGREGESESSSEEHQGPLDVCSQAATGSLVALCFPSLVVVGSISGECPSTALPLGALFCPPLSWLFEKGGGGIFWGDEGVREGSLESSCFAMPSEKRRD